MRLGGNKEGVLHKAFWRLFEGCSALLKWLVSLLYNNIPTDEVIRGKIIMNGECARKQSWTVSGSGLAIAWKD
jgi:hypothetical protein